MCPSESCAEVIRTPRCPRTSHLHFRIHIHNLLQIHKVTMAKSTLCALHSGKTSMPDWLYKLSTYSRQSEQGLVQMIATTVVRRDVCRECVQMCQPDFLQVFFLHCRVLSHRCWLISSSTPSSIASQHSFNLVVEHWSVWSNGTTCTTVHAMAIRAVMRSPTSVKRNDQMQESWAVTALFQLVVFSSSVQITRPLDLA